MTPRQGTRMHGRNALVLLALLGLGGCVSTGSQRGHPLVPAKFLTRTGPYRVWTNEPIAADSEAVRELASLERQVQRTLGVRVDPEADPIEVYILDNSKTFEHFLTFYYPELPSRRAFFLARGDRRVVYTYFGSRLSEDLRHEATHALLNVSTPELPLWLDEGLAEYFEVPERQGGLNLEHLARLPGDRDKGWTPALAQLERLEDVRQMTPRDYRESWAWVHFLLDGPEHNRGELLSYLTDLRTGVQPTPLSERLDAEFEQPPGELIAHLDRCRETGPVATVSERNLVYRLQNPVHDAPSRTPVRVLDGGGGRLAQERSEARRKGFFGRMFDLFR